MDKNAKVLGAVHTLSLLKIKNEINKRGIMNKGHPL